jgi:D-3-phosphoglycerate dehydrogenase
MKNSVLLVDSVHNIIPERLAKYGFKVDSGMDWSRDEIISKLSDYCGIVIRSRINIDKEFIDAGINLKFIARVGAGMESIDIKYCKLKNITCLNSPEGNRDAVGEHAIGMILSLFNKLNKADREVKSGNWNREENRGLELKGKIVGIIGYGNMGSSFAKKLSGFDCKVISYDKYKHDYSDAFTEAVRLEDIFSRADILSLHVPLTEETKYLVNQTFISRFNKPFYLINTARGPVVETQALVEALKSGKILGAGLDVIEYEETSFETTKSMLENEDFKYLSTCENVLMTPHIAGWTNESKIKLAEVLANKIIALKL